jgi:hypothetical protein
LLGIGGALVAGVPVDDSQDGGTVAAPGSPLQTSDGQTVGTAAVSYLDDQRVVVVAVSAAGDGQRYECRLHLADGTTTTVGEWVVPESGATWVMPAPATPAVSVELVAENGAVWSTASL